MVLCKLQISNISLPCMLLCVASYMVLTFCSSLCWQMGHIQYFFLEDWKVVTDFCHSVGIRELYANQMGTHLVVVDDKSEGYMYNPVSVLMDYSSSEPCMISPFLEPSIHKTCSCTEKPHLILTIQVFCDVMVSLGECSWPCKGAAIFWRVGIHSSSDTTSCHRSNEFSQPQPWDIKSHVMNVVRLVQSDAVCVEFHDVLSLGKGRESISQVVAPIGKEFVHS
jgi:hypothetical protein